MNLLNTAAENQGHRPATNAKSLSRVFLQTGAKSQYFKVPENSDLKDIKPLHFDNI